MTRTTGRVLRLLTLLQGRRVWTSTELSERLRVDARTIRRDVGWDLSAALIYRPSAIQNVVFRLSGALLQPGTGFRDLFTNEPRDERYYSILLNTILTY